ncbi:hypothetical protein K466DRAFT_601200 [Polyporus arcularius HHB13444]|uniref:Uncharacterized protein n=1 Tax=Polyporus arcularius HHB13444 TaxID=1314778 RepID=A0A5C3P922_9APHY|nr:hypothetical protein K466DRAFT_601200 [Polyporus arcularius HHB13444]
MLEIIALHSYVSTGLAALVKLVTLVLRFTKENVSFVSRALLHVHSTDLRSLTPDDRPPS